MRFPFPLPLTYPSPPTKLYPRFSSPLVGADSGGGREDVARPRATETRGGWAFTSRLYADVV
jgi:hypothetical protein